MRARLFESKGWAAPVRLLAGLALLAGCAEGKDPPAATAVVALAGGSFTMGLAEGDACGLFENRDRRSFLPTDPRVESARIRHEVTVEAFCIDAHEVTNEQYRHCVARGDCEFPQSTNAGNRSQDGFVAEYYGEDDGYDGYPVLGVAHEDAIAYCNFRGGYLPTEAQWEYAATSRGTRERVWDDAALDARVAENCINGGTPGELAFGACAQGVAPVGESTADVTADGVFDMAGNAAEWVADDFDYFAYCADMQPGGRVTDVFSVDGSRPLISASMAFVAPFEPEQPDQAPPLTAGGDGFGGSGFDGACYTVFDGCLEVCADAFGVDADAREQRERWPAYLCGNKAGLSDSVIEALRVGERGEDGAVTGCDAACATEWDRCVAEDAGMVPDDGSACLTGCQARADACLIDAAVPGVSTACVQFRESANCVPVPWCLPRADHNAKTPRIRPAAFAGNVGGTKAVRGGHFQSGMACEARPAWRDHTLVSSPLVGFRCAYDPGQGNCPQ